MLQAIATRALSQALSSDLPSPAHALSISADPAAIIHMDLVAVSASLTQPAASSASTGSMLPAIAAQQTHMGSNADNHPMPSPNYRMDHVLADSLHAGLHASHDFGPMSLASAMSNDENLTPAASRDFGRPARAVTQEGGAAEAEAPQVTLLLLTKLLTYHYNVSSSWAPSYCVCKTRLPYASNQTVHQTSPRS